MCGIAGQISYKKIIKVRNIHAMIQALSHRGPDDAGIYVNVQESEYERLKPLKNDLKGPFVGLGHRRLSIIDLSTGHQPIHNEDRSIWIVYNGEVYNFNRLRKELIVKGHKFYTATDTETIIHLYEEYGENCVKYLRGMFVFAIWDDNKKKLFIARDRIGKKPLYYSWDNSTLHFASELKGILRCPELKRDIDIDGLLHYLQFGYIPDPLSIFKNVCKLQPGQYLTIQNGKLTKRKYYNLNFETINYDNEQEIFQKFQSILEESVKIRLISDVPLGAFLSGGIDSSTIVALMALEMGIPVKTFSIGFEEDEYNELPYARKIAAKYGTDHHEMIVRPDNFDLIDNIIKYFDEPFGDPSSIPTYYVSKLASSLVKVVLSGDGGDELFGGYDSYAVTICRNKYQKIPSVIRGGIKNASAWLPSGVFGKNYLYNIALPIEERFLDYISHISIQRHQNLLSSDMFENLKKYKPLFYNYFEKVSNINPLSKLQYIDMNTYLPGDILVKVDRMSMAHSIEVRVPFLDQELVNFVNSIDPYFKVNCLERKYILKKLAKSLLPSEIIKKRKQGFAIPLKYWFKDDLNNYMKDILFDPKSQNRGYFNQNYLKKIISNHERGRKDHSTILWHLMVLELWHRNYYDG